MIKGCHTKKEMHSRDTTVLIDFLWFNVVHYSSLFLYFFQSTMVPTLVENSYVHLFVETLLWWLWLKNNTGADPGEFKGFHGTPFFLSDRPLISCQKFYIGKLKSVYYYATKFYNKTLTFTSFFSAKSLVQHWYAISASKIIIVGFVFKKLIQVMLEAFYRFTEEWIFVCELLSPGQ